MCVYGETEITFDQLILSSAFLNARRLLVEYFYIDILLLFSTESEDLLQHWIQSGAISGAAA